MILDVVADPSLRRVALVFEPLNSAVGFEHIVVQAIPVRGDKVGITIAVQTQAETSRRQNVHLPDTGQIEVDHVPLVERRRSTADPVVVLLLDGQNAELDARFEDTGRVLEHDRAFGGLAEQFVCR